MKLKDYEKLKNTKKYKQATKQVKKVRQQLKQKLGINHEL